eukprot:514293-Rhodomonas_salina.2
MMLLPRERRPRCRERCRGRSPERDRMQPSPRAPRPRAAARAREPQHEDDAHCHAAASRHVRSGAVSGMASATDLGLTDPSLSGGVKEVGFSHVVEAEQPQHRP